MRIHAPIPRGSGARVLHDTLVAGIDGYRVASYSPWWTLCPPALPFFSSSRAQLVHTAADYGMWFKRPGVPLVATLHNYVCDPFMRPYSSPLQYLHYRTDLRWFSRRTLAKADVVVAVSRFVADLARSDMGVERTIQVIYNGVDEQRFTPARTARATGPFRVLFSGNFSRRKRAELLPRLAALLGPGFEVWVTGDPGRAALRSSTTQLRHVGQVAHADMPELYRQVDALFMPSVREGFGLAVAEAMASALPVVACRESALPELVLDGEGGMLCAVDDVDGYTEALRRLAAEPALVRGMGEFNRARVEQMFTAQRMVADYRQLFERVLDRDPSLLRG